MNSSVPLLDIRDLRVSFPNAGGMLNAIRGVSFQIASEESLCLVGESGCGKSLTALALMGLLPNPAQWQASHFHFDGADMLASEASGMATRRGRDVAMIFQDPMTSLNPTLTIERQLCEGVMRTGMNKPDARRRAVALLDRVGIAHADRRLLQYPHQFSGGQRQRVMIAMALMTRPKLLIADEPTTALDVTIQAQTLNLIQELRREFGLALLLITHDLGVAAGVADRICVMYAGRIVEYGQTAAVFSRPLHPYTRGLMGASPIPGVTLPGSALAAIPGSVPELVGEVQGCAFHSRCAEVMLSCQSAKPPLRSGGSGHHYECLLDRNAEQAGP